MEYSMDSIKKKKIKLLNKHYKKDVIISGTLALTIFPK